MTTKKDFSINENIDREKGTKDGIVSNIPTGDLHEKNEKGFAETEVKNANAAGDGSFGRSETTLFEGDEEKVKQDEPPY